MGACILYRNVDGTNFDIVCANAPVLVWNDWSRFPDWIGHYARCLFNPLNGFDRTGEVKAEWENSAVADAVDAFNNAGAIVGVTGQCGLHDTYGIPGVLVLPIDTCTWTWVTPIQGILRIGIYIAGSLGFIVVIIKVMSGLVSRKLPTPFGDDRATEGDD